MKFDTDGLQDDLDEWLSSPWAWRKYPHLFPKDEDNRKRASYIEHRFKATIFK